jgi:hypothetical protein
MSAPAIRIYDEVAVVVSVVNVVVQYAGEAAGHSVHRDTDSSVIASARAPRVFAHRLSELRRPVTGGSV